MYCRPREREGLKKTRATTSQAFWAADNRLSDAWDSRVHCLPEPHETQPSAPDSAVSNVGPAGSGSTGPITATITGATNGVTFQIASNNCPAGGLAPGATSGSG